MEKLTAKERVKRIINRKSFDLIPNSYDLTSSIAEKTSFHYGIETSELAGFIGDNLEYVSYIDDPEFISTCINDEHYIDEFQVVWEKSRLKNIGDWGSIIKSPLKEASLKGYRFPETSKPGRFRHLSKETMDAQRYSIVCMDGIFDISWRLRGFENLLVDFALDEDYLDELLDKVLEYNLGIINQIPGFIDGIRFGEDWGQQNGMLMSAAIWRKYLKPRLKIMYEATLKKGLNVFIHSCGNICEIFPDLSDMGVQVVNPVQPEVMDVAALKKEYGKDLILYGGMGCQSTIPNGTVNEVLDEARRILDVLGRDGGYIFGPAGAIPADAKLENVVALMDFTRKGYAG